MSNVKRRDNEKTNLAKIFGNVVLTATLLVGAYLSSGILYSWADEDDADNFIAIHDRHSLQYEKHCLDCHESVLEEQSLNSDIPTAHRAMLPSTPGKDDEDKCVFCHRGVDLIQGPQPANKTTANLRKQVNVKVCVLCHGGVSADPKFYQTGLFDDVTELSATEGEVLYDLACSACHRDLANSKVRGESVNDIQKKIDENEGGMGPLDVLSAQEIQAIAAALADGHDDDDD